MSWADTGRLTGAWSGILDAGSQRLRLKLDIRSGDVAVLYSLDQGGEPIPAKVVSASAELVRIEVRAIQGSFVGRLVSPDRMEGVWRQGGDLPLVLTRGEPPEAAVPVEPLTPARLAELRRQAGSPALGAISGGRERHPNLWVTGERLVDSGILVRPTDLWHVGSITKSMTSTLAARLVDAGELSWDDTVGASLAEVAPDMRPEYKDVKLRYLLSHRSGLPGNIPLADLEKYSHDISDAREERRAYARQALSLAPVAALDSAFEYSNNGYVVAAAMLEARFGAPWEQLIRTHLFDPLGIKSAGFGAPGRAGAIEQPVGHARDSSGEKRSARPLGQGVTDNPVVLSPAGRVHLSLRDLLTYLAAHRDRSDLLRSATWKTLHTPVSGGESAMGWAVRPDGTLWHNGTNSLWYAEVMVDPKVGIAAAAVANDGYLEKSTYAVGSALLGAASKAAMG